MKQVLIGLMFVMLCIGMLTLAFNIQPVRAEPKTWYVDDDGPADFSKIQDAINAASPGDTIYENNGTYYGNIVVNKTVSLVGESRENTLVDGGRTGSVISMMTNNVIASPQAHSITYTRTYLPNEWVPNGVAMGWHADDNSWSYTLPFDFPFYGTYYTTMYISSNGLITFTGPDRSYSNSISGLSGKLAIAPAWYDWETNAPHDIYIWQPDSSHVIIRWEVAALYDSGTAANFEVILGSDGVIQFNYGQNNGPIWATVGISNGAGAILAEDVTDLNYTNTILFTPFRTEHDLEVYLDAPDNLAPGQSSILNATVTNSGLNGETGVELQLLINDTIVDSVVIPELLTESSYTANYAWTPTAYGKYNITAYAPPVPDETITANNFATKIVSTAVTIYIRADGSIDPPTALIQREEDTYTLVGNITADTDGIVIERNNMTLDGAGYTIQGTGAYESRGLSLSSVSNVRVENVTVLGFFNCIYLSSSSSDMLFGSNIESGGAGGWAHCSVKLISSSNNAIQGNNITSSGVHGVRLESSSSNVISENNLTTNYYAIQLVSSSSGNTVSANSITNNDFGLVLDESSNNTIFGNLMNSNWYNLAVAGSTLSAFLNSIDVSNTVDGKPVYYLVSQKDLAINPATYPEIGYLALINCTGIAVQGLNLTNNWQGLLLAYTNDSKIAYNTMVENYLGVGIWYSSNNNIIVGNNMTDDYAGIYLETSENTSIIGNSMARNVYGFWFYGSPSNSIVGNNVTDNDCGIFLYGSPKNVVYHNNFLNTWEQAVSTELNVWDDGYPSGGNYWSDYVGADVNSGQYQNETGSDGIGDTPYAVNADNLDNYPLMSPWMHIVGDLNLDGKVSLADLLLVTLAYNSKLGDPNWNSMADIASPYGIIGLTDVVTLAMHYGRHNP